MTPYRIALIGAGTVGSQVLELLARNSAACEERSGRPLEVVAVAVRDPRKPRPSLPSTIRRQSPEEICSAPDIDLVVEVAGGVEEPL